MSTLEERREARRRRRAQEDEPSGTLSKSEISQLVDARLQERRLERQRRRQELAATSVNGGEDDLERRRRERREARLRGGEAPAEEEQTSRRSRRNRGGDDEPAAEETSSARSRRRRGGDEEEAPAPEPEPEKPAEEESAPAAEEDDSAAREAEEAERRRREEEEEEERRRQQEERRKQEEERRRQEEERRRQEEEERKRRTLKRGADPEHAGRSVHIAAKSPRHSVASPAEFSSQACSSARSTHSGLPNTGRSLSDCYFNYASDDAISEIAMENERLMEVSDYDLGSSFEDVIFEPGEKMLLMDPATRARQRAALNSPSSSKNIPSTNVPKSQETHHQGKSLTSDHSASRGGSAETDSDADSYCSQDDDEDGSIPFGREHQGTMVEGDQASNDIKAYNARRNAEKIPSKETTQSSVAQDDAGETREVNRKDRMFVQEDRNAFEVEVNDTGQDAAKPQQHDDTAAQSRSVSAKYLTEHIGARRSISGPVVQPSAVRHQDIASRMSELQRQLHGNRSGDGVSSMRKMRSQGDLSPSGQKVTPTKSKLNELLGQLSNRLKSRDGARSAGLPEESDDPPLSPLYRSQSESAVADMKEEKLNESPVAQPQAQRGDPDDSLLEEEQSFADDTDSDAPSSGRQSAGNKHASMDVPRHNPPQHAAPRTPSVARPAGSRGQGGRPDKIKEELRLCLDFLDDPDEELFSEEEEEVENVSNNTKFTQNTGVAEQIHSPYHSSSESSCSDVSPRQDYCETDENFAEDEASYTHGGSTSYLNISEDSFSQPLTPGRSRAASEPAIWTQENVHVPQDVDVQETTTSSTTNETPAKTSEYVAVPESKPEKSVKTSKFSLQPGCEESDQRQKLFSEIRARAKYLGTDNCPDSSWNDRTEPVSKPKESEGRVLEKPVIRNDKKPAPEKKREASTGDLHALLCAEIVHVGLKRASSRVTDSVVQSPVKATSHEHLIKPSALKSLQTLDIPSIKLATDSEKHGKVSAPAVVNDKPSKAPKTADDEVFERKNLMSFWQKKAEETAQLVQQSPSKSSPQGRKAFQTRGKTGDTRHDLTGTPDNNEPRDKTQTLKDSKQSEIKRVGNDERVACLSRQDSVDSIDSVFTPGSATPISVERKAYLPRSLPPEDGLVRHDSDKSSSGVPVLTPTPQQLNLPASPSWSKLQRPSAFIANNSAVVTWSPSQNRTSSSSSIDRELNANSPIQKAPGTSHLSLREVERRNSSTGPPVQPRKVSLSDLQKSLQKTTTSYVHDEQPSYESDAGGLKRHSLVGSPLRRSLTDTGSIELYQNKADRIVSNDEPDDTRGSSAEPSGDGAPKKRMAPRPRFNARRLTQDCNIPVVWQCSEDAKTPFNPSQLSISYDNLPSAPSLSVSAPHADAPLQIQGSDMADNKYKSWAADFLKDRILLTKDSDGENSARGTPTIDTKASPSSPGVEYPWARGGRRYSNLPMDDEPLPVQAAPVKSKPMSITERISMLSKSRSPKTSTSSEFKPDFKPGSISDREGPEDTPRVKSSRDGPTLEQKKFASLLQNRLINIIAEEDKEDKQRARKPPAQRKKLTPAQEIARSRAMSSSRSKGSVSDTDSPKWNPHRSSPAHLGRVSTDPQLLKRHGSVKDIAKEFDHLTDSFSKDEDKDNPLAVTHKRGRRLSTGLTVKEMKGMFDNPDSLPSSRNSTRPNSPKVVSSIPERVIERFETPAIPETRPLVDKDMVLLSRTGTRSSVADIVNRVETVGMENGRRSDEDRARVEVAPRKTSVSLLRVGAVVTDDTGAPVSKIKKDKSRRYTTGVNFAELQLRFTQPNHDVKKSNQSRAMSTIYASSQDLTKRTEPFKSAYSMENLAQDTAVSIYRHAKTHLEVSADDSLDVSRDSIFEGRKSRSGSFVEAPDIQSASGSAFSRLSTAHSPIKVAEATFSSSTSSLNRSPDVDVVARRDSSAASSDRLSVAHPAPANSVNKYRRAAEEEERAEQERMEREREEEERRREEEEKKKKKGKRKGLGGLSPEKKKLLKKLIMQKAAEDLRNEAKAKALEKEKYINERVAPLKAEGMNQADLQKLVKELHAKVAGLEEEVYDWEIKIRKQDFEINELTLKVNDTKGKFIKPVLRKVNKTESKLTKLQTKESRDFRGNLKSTGQNKFALKEEDDAGKTPDWREALKHGQEGGEEAPAAES